MMLKPFDGAENGKSKLWKPKLRFEKQKKLWQWTGMLKISNRTTFLNVIRDR